MRSYVIIVILSIVACQSPLNNPQETKITQAETQIAKDLIQGAFDKLWGGVDTTKLSNFHTDDFIILEHGEIWDNDRIKQYMIEQSERVDRPKRLNSMEFISVDKYGESMQIAYHNYAKFMKNDSLVGQAKWLESALAVKTQNGWRLKMMHSTFAGNEF
jgi:hypothetical protein